MNTNYIIAKGKVTSSFYDGQDGKAKIKLDNVDEVRSFYNEVTFSKRFTPDILADMECDTINLHTRYSMLLNGNRDDELTAEEFGRLAVGTYIEVAIRTNKDSTAIYPFAVNFPDGYEVEEITHFNPFA